jgi:hypothetical protein
MGLTTLGLIKWVLVNWRSTSITLPHDYLRASLYRLDLALAMGMPKSVAVEVFDAFHSELKGFGMAFKRINR